MKTSYMISANYDLLPNEFKKFSDAVAFTKNLVPDARKQNSYTFITPECTYTILTILSRDEEKQFSKVTVKRETIKLNMYKYLHDTSKKYIAYFMIDAEDGAVWVDSVKDRNSYIQYRSDSIIDIISEVENYDYDKYYFCMFYEYKEGLLDLICEFLQTKGFNIV